MRAGLIAPLEDELEEGEVSIDEDQSQEAETIKHATDPKDPTPEQLEAHRTGGHYPYRIWCKWCILGRGLGMQHKPTDGSAVPVVGIDYFFITSGGVKKRNELGIAETDEGDKAVNEARSTGSMVKCVLVRCWKSKIIYAHVVPVKGDDEDHYTAKLIVADLDWMGHTKLIVKADNERAIKAVKERVIKIIRERSPGVANVQEESPPAYDSQANGGTEVGVRIVRGLFRTMELCLEARLSKFIPVDHALIPWLLQHVCITLNAKSQGSDGLTPWARIKGRSFNQRLLGFAEDVLYKLPVKGPRSAPDGNMGTRWLEGTFVGFSRASNAYIVITPENQVVTARSIYRRPMSNRWRAERLAQITATPWSTRDQAQAQARFSDTTEQEEQKAPATTAPMPRAFRINPKDLKKFGYTVGCSQCEHMERYGQAKNGITHSGPCRKRIMDEFSKTPEGQARLDSYEERVDRAIAERIEADDQEKMAASAAARLPQSAEEPQPRPEPELTGGSSSSTAPPPPHAAPRRVRWDEEVDFDDQIPNAHCHVPATSGTATAATAPELHEGAMEEDVGDPTSADMDVGHIGHLEPEAGDAIAGLLLQQLGAVGHSYKREARRGFKKLVSEVYSPPRITAASRRGRYAHLAPGLAFDITVNDPDDGMPWDFTRRDKRDKARALLRKYRPLLLIGSPMCTAFSTFQNINRYKYVDPGAKQRAYVQACLHMEFVASLYREQLESGGYFLHEHPQWASSWELKCMADLECMPGVDKIRGDQCQFGAVAPHGPNAGAPVLKPTRFLTNSEELKKALARRCTGTGGRCSRPEGGVHTQCNGSITAEMAKYPRELCRAVLRGITRQLHADRRMKPGCYGVQAVDDEEEIKQHSYGPEQGFSGRFRDDLTGQVLRDDLVLQARMKELEFFHSKGVWLKVPRDRARAVTGRNPISVRWVDVNKGDELEPKYRSRLVARQMKALDKSGTSYFAPAPPLEALRTVLSMAMTRCGSHQPIWDPASPQRTQLSFIDVTRAYFNAKVDREASPCFVELPPEDPECGQSCGELIRHMYGTRPAADGWQEEYSTLLVA